MRYLPSWSLLPRTERICLGISLAFAVGAIAFFSFWADPGQIIALIKEAGLGSLILCIGVTAHAGAKVLKSFLERQSLATGVWQFIRRRRLLACTWLACSLVTISVFPMGNRILMDEIIVLSTSKAIHEEREPVTPSSLVTYNGVHKLTAAYIDKRPYLYATLVSFCHDLLGYSPKNAFYTNMLLASLTLALVGILGTRLGGAKEAGVVAMIALAAVPLFCEHATGGGIDVANLFCISLLLLGGMIYHEHPSIHSARLLLGCAVLLAYARYESLLFMAVPVVLMTSVFARERRLFLDWPSLAMWPAIVPLCGIHYITFSHAAQSFQLADQGVSEAFSVAYIPENLAHALYFFVNTQHLLTNSPVVFVAGVIAVALIVVVTINRRRKGEAGGPGITFWTFAGVSFLSLGLLMAYSWGRLDEIIASRLSLPLYLLFVLSIAAVCREIRDRRRYVFGLGALFGISMYWSCFPLAAKQYAVKVYTGVQRQAVMDEFNRSQPDRHFAVLNNITNFWLTRDVYAVSPSSLINNPKFLANMLSSGEFRRIYLIQTQSWDSKTAAYVTNPGDVLSIPVDLEPLSEDVVTGDMKIKVALIKDTSLQRLRAAALPR